jgi:hypothetical protein
MKRFKELYWKWWNSESDNWQIIFALSYGLVFVLCLISTWWLAIAGIAWVLFFVWLHYEGHKCDDDCACELFWTTDETIGYNPQCSVYTVRETWIKFYIKAARLWVEKAREMIDLDGYEAVNTSKLYECFSKAESHMLNAQRYIENEDGVWKEK